MDTNARLLGRRGNKELQNKSCLGEERVQLQKLEEGSPSLNNNSVAGGSDVKFHVVEGPATSHRVVAGQI